MFEAGKSDRMREFLVNLLSAVSNLLPVYVDLQSLNSHPLPPVCPLAFLHFSFLGDGGWKVQNKTASQPVQIGALTPVL